MLLKKAAITLQKKLETNLTNKLASILEGSSTDFIKKIFEFMKKHNILKNLVYKLEDRAAKKSSGVEKGEFIFLLLFVGIPLPGTGAWTGSLIASLLEKHLLRF